MNPVRIIRRLGRLLPRFVTGADAGSADLNTYLLLTAAGCVMVGLTAPRWRILTWFSKVLEAVSDDLNM